MKEEAIHTLYYLCITLVFFGDSVEKRYMEIKDQLHLHQNEHDYQIQNGIVQDYVESSVQLNEDQLLTTHSTHQHYHQLNYDQVPL